jgi:lactobin A/cerein 7B family class IIb bacteriocin
MVRTNTETEMRLAEKSDACSLADAELAGVNGGAIPIAIAAVAAVAALTAIGIGWSRLPVGKTAQDAAAALGASHLL